MNGLTNECALWSAFSFVWVDMECHCYALDTTLNISSLQNPAAKSIQTKNYYFPQSFQSL